MSDTITCIKKSTRIGGDIMCRLKSSEVYQLDNKPGTRVTCLKSFFCWENLNIVQKRTYFPPPPLHGCSTMVFFRIFYKRILSGGEDKNQESPSLFRPDSGKTAQGTQKNTFENVGRYVMQFFLQIHDAILTNTVCNYQNF